jgi:hypothetical protein
MAILSSAGYSTFGGNAAPFIYNSPIRAQPVPNELEHAASIATEKSSL